MCLIIRNRHEMNLKNNKRQLTILEKVIEENQNYLFRFAYFRIGKREIAEDIVQNVFLKLVEKGYDLSRVKSPKMYLFKMLSNSIVNYQNRHINKVVSINEIEELSLEEDSDAELQREYERIVHLLYDIPYEQAEVIRMNTIDNLSFVEIAEILNISVSTVKSRFMYGINKVRNKLQTINKQD